ncbi:extensin family protein [Qipengyuania nanhaisediminis]|uniref:extensin-like domain-containing protein n=1 Tax=Qipengyuania nanhaisediminis TaxID=604088 RepID=UPI0038B399AB
MPRSQNPFRISRKIGSFAGERRFIRLAIAALVLFAGYAWIKAHPQHDPTAPLDLRHPVGMATASKLAALKDDVPGCRAVLDRSEVAYAALEPAGEGACARPDRTRLGDYPLAPASPPMTCPMAAALELWRTGTVAPAARAIFGSDVARIEHLGVYSCRRLYGRSEGAWSEHATGNAIDIAGFVLEDGRSISVLSDWDSESGDDEARFLREIRQGACGVFATVLSPEYNQAHADHFHFDQDDRWAGLCR